MTREQFQLEEKCIFLTAEIHDVSAKLGYYDYASTDEIFRADLWNYQGMLQRDGNMIDTLIETLQEDSENTDDEELKNEIAQLIEMLEELKTC